MMLSEQTKPKEDYNGNKLESTSSESSFQSDGTSDKSSELPQTFHVKYLGSQDARGLWGIKHTRKPVDKMVEAAKSLPSGMNLPLLKIDVSEHEVSFYSLNKKDPNVNIQKTFPIRDISYGVQDIVYTRIFSMIVVRDTDNFRRITPFECHGFVCESKHQARELTYALSNAFKLHSEKLKENRENIPVEKQPSNIKIIPQNIRVDIICKT